MKQIFKKTINFFKSDEIRRNQILINYLKESINDQMVYIQSLKKQIELKEYNEKFQPFSEYENKKNKKKVIKKKVKAVKKK